MVVKREVVKERYSVLNFVKRYFCVACPTC
jgi:hypothetical protein